MWFKESHHVKNEKCHYIYGKHQVPVVHGLSVTAVLTEKFAAFSRASLCSKAEHSEQKSGKNVKFQLW